MDRDTIQDQINRILRSNSFADKSQLKRLLKVLLCNIDSQVTLKPDRVIKELWPEDAAAKHSTDVATEMNRLRRALKAYYALEGATDPIVIRLPNRSTPGSGGLKERQWITWEARELLEGAPTALEGAPTAPEPLDILLRVPSVERLTPPALPAAIPQAKSYAGWKVWAAIGLLVIAVCAATAAAFISGDRRPQLARMDGTTLTILNAEGQELWHKSFPDGLWHEYYGPGFQEPGLVPRIWFGDLQGTGHTNVLLLYHPATNPLSHSTILICYSDRGKEQWRWTPGRVLPELNGSPALFTTIGFGVLKAKMGESRRIVVSSRHDIYYPHQIAIVNANGKTVSEYWHSGHLEHLTLASLDGGRSEQILSTGISNGYHEATLIVLDPDRVSGASTEAARPEIQLHGLGVAHERLRLLFPRSDLNRDLSVYNEGGEMTVNQGRIRFPVRECMQRPSCYIWYELDGDFRLRSATADDQFRNAHKEFYLKTKTSHSFTEQEESEFQKVRCLAGCQTEYVPSLVP